ncbi:hypothetical protein CEP51_013642 [Fusarium floridanum]|uniref:Enoyl reductase (ER) domain-containing protein n=1 Tax=Fusarium floridanum TaxID=1325733 RepID=A0A428Q7Z4_9HYPO|nr:hypothetical protein CEP51_013642 [Fusarium floridanum]
MASMRAWQAASPGTFPQILTLRTDIPRPSNLQDGQILVQVSHAGLNPADYKMCELGVASRAITSFPKIPGMDLAGRVVEIAQGVTEAKVGDLVMARVDPTKPGGSLAEYVVVNRDGYATLPAGFDTEQAAGAPTAAVTAYQTIAPYVKAGDKVFINGGSGGVGLFGIQIAKALGCEVTVTCSTAKAELCKSLGADDIIDYKTSDVLAELKKRGQVFRHCVDNVGDSPSNLYAFSDNFLFNGSKFLFVGGHVSAGSILSIMKTRMLPTFLGGGKNHFVSYMTSNKREDIEQVRDWFVEGKVRTVVDSVFDFEEVDKAFEQLKKGSSGGKIIIQVQK